jgi:hypothetical protein
MSAIDQRRQGTTPAFNRPARDIGSSLIGQSPMTPIVYSAVRLTAAQYKELEAKVLQGQGNVREDTTPVQSGFRNGIEHVLRAVREGFTDAS